MNKGTEEGFQVMLQSIHKACKQYEAGEIKHIKYSETMEYIYTNYGWNKVEFSKELNKRLKIHTNESREDKANAAAATKKRRTRKAPR